jgi:nucleotide-binding universal stress UspA family protein
VSYVSLMVNLELGRSNGDLLHIAANLAGRFQAAVIGIATCQPMQVDFGDSYVSGDLFEADREQIRVDIDAAEAEFRSAFAASAANIEWRSSTTFESLAEYLAREARSADLIITGLSTDEAAATRRVDIGDLVTQAGRPVLIVPAQAKQLALEKVVVAWNDTRETRRSVFDALPVLKMAGAVVVVEIVAEDELADANARLDDVVGWLSHHGIAARALAYASSGDDTARLRQIVAEHSADVLVAGAYGHSRVREWVFGGVTRDLLLRGSCCALVSH